MSDEISELFAATRGQGDLVGADCTVLLDEIRLVRVSEEAVGAPMHWYFAPTDSGGGWHWFVRVDEDGSITDRSGRTGGCEHGQDPDEDGLWYENGGGSYTEVVHAGRAPTGSDRVRLTFEGHDPVEVEVNRAGFFIAVLPESSCCSWAFLDLLEALDRDGEVIAKLP